MTRFVRIFVAAVGLLVLAVPMMGSADDDRHDNDRRIRTDLSGFNDVVGPNLGVGAVFSTGSGQLKLKIDRRNREIEYELSFDFPDAADTPTLGTQFVNQGHIHFGQRHTTGGIPVWLCQSADSPAPPAVAADTPMCPSPGGTVTGTITPAKVLALAAQGFPAGEEGFDALLEALRTGTAYGNVHTDRFPAGEIRGQLNDRDDD